ncbi:putative bifunctional diguanylate cyclase/phosphodiesterase [Yoonia sediminilitoris]|uniref:Diguanylate cyclase (GGDEF)-like protein n=1 Tax=Yoonia sediminilitoris TaxID=1286148 RepID=A0A2T6KRP8_9RHOB|nr:bifunctional diguanylate cyclase/phosphodiesterase [Yoonia sediminilitoris]PUB19232.1 diguanylate cyclase (GGDEF)-like protein [Yoonia sediminilitoris]RCW99400.1 diguanylate cyclase (GGDEF)-like protein [Yoonia sediminilitoris]
MRDPLPRAILESLCPCAAVFDADGTILHSGPTLEKAYGEPLAGKNLLDIFKVTAPRALSKTKDFKRFLTRKISVTLMRPDGDHRIAFRSQFISISDDDRTFIVNCSFGQSLLSSVEILDLEEGNFSFADPSMDLFNSLSVQQELITEHQHLTEKLKSAKQSAERRANTDPLTDLPNRRAFSDHAERMLRSQKQDGKALAFLLIDLDKFKQVNDMFGHAAGDFVLKAATNVLRSAFGDNGFVARLSSDEFIALITGKDVLAEAEKLSFSIISQISEPIKYESSRVQIGASIGITTACPGQTKSLDQLLLEADLALFEAKEGGRLRSQVYDARLGRKYALMGRLTREMEPALAAGEFVPFFQPQIEPATGRLTGAEVLVRWLHPQLGLLNPVEFIFVAERNRMMGRIDHEVRKLALDTFKKWQRYGLQLDQMSFNLTAEKLGDKTFVDEIMRDIEQRKIKPSQICFELLESILIDGANAPVLEGAADLSFAGFKLALDDFGTGHASIASLISVPVDTVKIDRSFINGLHSSKRIRSMTKAIIGLCQQLRLKIVAEGVEDVRDLQLVQEMGCDYVQGYYFAKPMSSNDFWDWAQSRQIEACNVR